MISRYNQLIREIEARLARGLGATVATAANIFQENLGDDYPPSSVPGEYPARRTGQGQENIRAEVIAEELEAGFGMMGASQSDLPKQLPHTKPGAEHLVTLATTMGRKGPDDAFLENIDQLRERFEAAARRLRVNRGLPQ